MLGLLGKPKILWVGALIQSVALLLIYSQIVTTDGKQNTFSLYFSNLCEVSVYFLAALINFRISSEYKTNQLMRLAWIFLGLNALISVGRAFIGLPFWDHFIEGFITSRFNDNIHKVIIAFANGFLLMGLSAMWLSFKKSDLGFEIGTRGYVEIACILLLTFVLFFRIKVDPYSSGLVILSAASIASVILHKMALQMGGGKLAICLRILTLYTLMRAVFVLIETLLGLGDIERRQQIDWIMAVDLVVWKLVPWIAAIAASYRAEMIVHSRIELEKSRVEIVRATA